VSERVIADFVGEFYLSDMERADPVRGRIVMSPKRLVLAGESRRETIPTSTVFDIAVGQVPREVRKFFSDSVTVAYGDDGTRRTAIVEADSGTIEKFTDVLFRAHLNGRDVTVKHPARRGGRVVDTPARPARLAVDDRRLVFNGPDAGFDVDLTTVTGFERRERTFDGRPRPSLMGHHLPGTTALVSAVSLPSERLMNLLGRYLRLEYSDVREELADVSLSDEALQALIGIYSSDGEADPTDVITTEAGRRAVVLDRLLEKELVVDGESGVVLTPKGRVVVNSRLETVNS
jgi:helix-turn-helix protein